MNQKDLENYNRIRNGETGFYRQRRGLFAVWGKEAEQFLNGLITNDVKTLADGSQMLAAFPNAQGRLLAVVRVLHKGDRYYIETEEATREKVWNNLFRFTFAGDFFVEDLSPNFQFFSMQNGKWKMENNGLIHFENDVFVPKDLEIDISEFVEISDEVHEVLRIENGVPLYGIDMDETTIIPELGLEGLISYKKGCYIGQEIIARIYFRGHVAKQLKGLILMESGKWKMENGDELKTVDGKNAGRITSSCYSPKLEKNIALGYVRYDYLADGTELKFGETAAIVTDLPFVK